MHTVVITNRSSDQLLANTQFLFRSFVDDASDDAKLSFCEWNPGGVNFDSALPGLRDTLLEAPEWRAVIVIDPVDSMSDQVALGAFGDNPFDFKINKGKDAAVTTPEESSVPLIRLTHILAGFPPLETKGWDEVYTNIDSETGERVELRKSDCGEDFSKKLAQFKSKYGHGLTVTSEEIPHSDEDIEAYKDLVVKYRRDFFSPSEVILISTRKYSPERIAYENSGMVKDDEATDMEFWKRNNYPDICRFVCFDYEDPNARVPIKEKFEFAASVLTLCTNRIPASSLQAYNLYKMQVDISKDCLGIALSNHLGILFATKRYVEREIEKMLPMSFSEDADLLPPERIPVKLQAIDEDVLKVNTSGLGLASDCPQNEAVRWHKDVANSEKHVGKLLRLIARILEGHLKETRRKTNSFLGKEVSLDKFQVEDLREKIYGIEKKIFLSESRSTLKFAKYQIRLKDKDERTQRHIATRMNTNMIVLAGLAIAGIFSMGLLPYLYNILINQFALSSGAALGFVVLSLAVLCVGGLCALFVQRIQLRLRMGEYNGVIILLLNAIRRGSIQFETYLSDICTYMKGKSILIGADLGKSGRLTARRILEGHKRSIEALIVAQQELAASYGITLKVIKTSFDEGTLSLEKNSDNSRIYRLSKSRKGKTLELNQSGDYLDAPYDFIVGLHIRRENLSDELRQGT